MRDSRRSFLKKAAMVATAASTGLLAASSPAAVKAVEALAADLTGLYAGTALDPLKRGGFDAAAGAAHAELQRVVHGHWGRLSAIPTAVDPREVDRRLRKAWDVTFGMATSPWSSFDPADLAAGPLRASYRDPDATFPRHPYRFVSGGASVAERFGEAGAFSVADLARMAGAGGCCLAVMPSLYLSPGGDDLWTTTRRGRARNLARMMAYVTVGREAPIGVASPIAAR